MIECHIMFSICLTKNVIFSQVSRIYKDQSIGNPISISVMNIVPIDKVFGVRRTRSEGIAAADMLNKFCRWQQNNNPSESSPGHYDTALLLTRYLLRLITVFVTVISFKSDKWYG